MLNLSFWFYVTVLSKVIVTSLNLFVNRHYYLTTSKVNRTLERPVIHLLVSVAILADFLLNLAVFLTVTCKIFNVTVSCFCSRILKTVWQVEQETNCWPNICSNNF